MDRNQQMSELSAYIESVDKDMTMILQSLQWDRKRLLESPSLVACSYNPHHRVEPDKRAGHEERCMLRSQGYSEEEELLPDPPDPGAVTLVKLSNDDINEIIAHAAEMDPLFKRGRGPSHPLPSSLDPLLSSLDPPLALRDPPPGLRDLLPCSLSRLQQVYTRDERRAIHEAVVSAAPATHDLADLALVSDPGGEQRARERAKTRAEILAELRDMRRRRPKYRVSGNTKNFSHALRDVIAAQMEMYTQTHKTEGEIKIKVENDGDNRNVSNDNRDVRHVSETSYGHKSTRRDHNYRRGDYSRERDRQKDYGPSKRDRERNSSEKERSRGYDKDRDNSATRSNKDVNYTKDTKEHDTSKHEKRDKSHRHSKDREKRHEDGKDAKYTRENSKLKEKHNDSYGREKGLRKERSRHDYYDNSKHKRHSEDNYRDSSSSKSNLSQDDRRHRDRNYSERSGKEYTRHYDSVKVKEEPYDDDSQSNDSRKRRKHH